MNNLFKISKEEHINEIINTYTQKFIVIVFSVENEKIFKINIDREIKKKIKELSIKNKDCVFIYIDLKNFIPISEKYCKMVGADTIPYVSFYINKTQIGCVSKAIMSDIEEGLLELKKKDLLIKNNIEKKKEFDRAEKKRELENLNIEKQSQIINNQNETLKDNSNQIEIPFNLNISSYQQPIIIDQLNIKNEDFKISDSHVNYDKLTQEINENDLKERLDTIVILRKKKMIEELKKVKKLKEYDEK
jgi:hypothetical protein